MKYRDHEENPAFGIVDVDSTPWARAGDPHARVPALDRRHL
jgi:hypothetical protein